MDIRGAAEYLKVSTSTVLRAVYRGDLAPVEPRTNARLRHTKYSFRRSELDAFLSRPRKRKPRTPRPKD